MRFPLQIAKRVRETIGRRLLLYRIGADDLDPNGTQLEDSKAFALRLEEIGIDIIDVSGGLCGSRPAQFQNRQGYFIPQAQQIKEEINIPVIGVGGIQEPEYADQLIQEGQVDLVAIGRGLWKDPDWAKKAIRTLQEGR